MFAVFAAEQQYRHDVWAREREHALIASIRERKSEVAGHRRIRAAAMPQRAVWARPIGLHLADGRSPACAVA